MRLIVAILFILPFLCSAQGSTEVEPGLVGLDHDLQEFASAGTSSTEKLDKPRKFIDYLSKQRIRFSNDVDYLNFVFQRTHQKYLKHFATSTEFSELFSNGNYNCLTATSLFTIILEHLNYDVNIVETNYHVFLLVDLPDQRVLIETTDRLSGFVADPEKIAARMASYRNTQSITASRHQTLSYAYKISVYNSIHKQQLLGLIYYNLAVDAYNNRDLAKATDRLVSSYQLYPSKRLDEFTQVVLLTILKSNIAGDDQLHLLQKIQSMRASHIVAMKTKN
jgi:hypothetical protein